MLQCWLNFNTSNHLYTFHPGDQRRTSSGSKPSKGFPDSVTVDYCPKPPHLLLKFIWSWVVWHRLSHKRQQLHLTKRSSIFWSPRCSREGAATDGPQQIKPGTHAKERDKAACLHQRKKAASVVSLRDFFFCLCVLLLLAEANKLIRLHCWSPKARGKPTLFWLLGEVHLLGFWT
jgi:hypothetical protein